MHRYKVKFKAKNLFHSKKCANFNFYNIYNMLNIFKKWRPPSKRPKFWQYAKNLLAECKKGGAPATSSIFGDIKT